MSRFFRPAASWANVAIGQGLAVMHGVAVNEEFHLMEPSPTEGTKAVRVNIILTYPPNEIGFTLVLKRIEIYTMSKFGKHKLKLSAVAYSLNNIRICFRCSSDFARIILSIGQSKTNDLTILRLQITNLLIFQFPIFKFDILYYIA